MVRLKEGQRNEQNRMRIYFNSTMVRLKVGGNEEVVVINREFQFHYGTIKRFCAQHFRIAQVPFQFHYGTIKSLIAR